MKNITLINPEQAREVFISNGWTNNHNYFIKIAIFSPYKPNQKLESSVNTGY